MAPRGSGWHIWNLGRKGAVCHSRILYPAKLPFKVKAFADKDRKLTASQLSEKGSKTALEAERKWHQSLKFTGNKWYVFMRLGIYVFYYKTKQWLTLEFIVYMDVMCDKSRKLGEGNNSYSVVAYVTKLS